MPPTITALALFFAFMVMASLIPQPLTPATLLAAKAAPAWAVALVGAVAAGLAAIFDHYLVRRVFQLRLLVEVRKKRLFQRAEGWVRVAPFLTTFAFAALPVPFMIVRVLVPLTGYPASRYAVAVTLGRFPRVYFVAALGQALAIPTEVLVVMLCVGVTAALIGAIVKRRRQPPTPPVAP